MTAFHVLSMLCVLHMALQLTRRDWFLNGNGGCCRKCAGVWEHRRWWLF